MSQPSFFFRNLLRSGDAALEATYFAITIGKMNPKGFINSPVDDKIAETEFKVLKSVSSERFEFLNLVKLFPKTGRKHQLRKHLLDGDKMQKCNFN